MRHGKGLHTCSNGDVYKGYWRLDKRHGRGMAVLANGMQYEGEWVEDMAHGYAHQSSLALCIVYQQMGPQQRACDAHLVRAIDWSSNECRLCMKRTEMPVRRLLVLPVRDTQPNVCPLQEGQGQIHERGPL